MSEQIINVLDAICDKFGIAIDWTHENVLPYIQQLCNKYIHCQLPTTKVAGLQAPGSENDRDIHCLLP